eukprot:535100_1
MKTDFIRLIFFHLFELCAFSSYFDNVLTNLLQNSVPPYNALSPFESPSIRIEIHNAYHTLIDLHTLHHTHLYGLSHIKLTLYLTQIPIRFEIFAWYMMGVTEF